MVLLSIETSKGVGEKEKEVKTKNTFLVKRARRIYIKSPKAFSGNS